MFKKRLYLIFICNSPIKDLYCTIRTLYYNKKTEKYHSVGHPEIIWDTKNLRNNTVTGVAFRNRQDALTFAEGGRWLRDHLTFGDGRCKS